MAGNAVPYFVINPVNLYFSTSMHIFLCLHQNDGNTVELELLVYGDLKR